MASEPKRCFATKRSGEPCNAIGVLDSGYCFHHDPDRRAEAHAARVKGGEATRKPKATETLREMVEADIEAWLKPYVVARESGDPALAMKASDTVLDRVYGRAKQSSEISGPDGGPLTIEELAVHALEQGLGTASEAEAKG
jgi:hypothetical protein